MWTKIKCLDHKGILLEYPILKKCHKGPQPLV